MDEIDYSDSVNHCDQTTNSKEFPNRDIRPENPQHFLVLHAFFCRGLTYLKRVSP